MKKDSWISMSLWKNSDLWKDFSMCVGIWLVRTKNRGCSRSKTASWWNEPPCHLTPWSNRGQNAQNALERHNITYMYIPLLYPSSWRSVSALLGKKQDEITLLVNNYQVLYVQLIPLVASVRPGHQSNPLNFLKGDKKHTKKNETF